MTDRNARLTVDGLDEPIDLSIYPSTAGPDVINVSGLSKKGFFTYDPGFMSTAPCESKITFIDGAKGVLLHRGYPIDQLAEKSDYLETCYLLLNGELPTDQEKAAFTQEVKKHAKVDESVARVISGFNRDAHPMAILGSAVGALAAVYHEQTDITKEEDRRTTGYRLIGQMPTLAAMVHKHRLGEAFIEPDESLAYAENYLNMTFGTAGKAPSVNKILAKAMDRIFLLHADHEQNASTSTVRLSVRLFRYQSLRSHCRRHRHPLGASPRRRQRGRAEHARRDWQRGQYRRLCRQSQR